MKIEKTKLVIKVRILLFVLLLLSYCLTSSDNVSTNSNSLIKYAMLFLCIFHSGIEYFSKKKIKKEKKEYNGLWIVVGVITIYSLMRTLIVMKFTFRTIQELIFLVFPMVYGYFVINTWDYKEINKAFKIGIIISFLSYIISLQMSPIEIVQSLSDANFNTSYSSLESFTYCGLALAFFVYFSFWDDKKIYTILSALFVIMTFKRLFIVMAIILFLISRTPLKNKSVSNKFLYFTTTILFVVAIFYYWAMQPENAQMIEYQYNIDLRKLTMTRNDRMRWLVDSPYKSYGFGSSTEYMYELFYGALEMDMCKIIVELGYLPVLIFIYNYLKFSKKSFYAFVFMSLMILNLTFSSGLTGTFSWCILFITISSINIKMKDEEEKKNEKS